MTTDDKRPFITVYKSCAGWKSQMVVWNDDEEIGGFWEPFQVSHFGYLTREEAIVDGKSWAEAEELEFRS